MKASQKIMVNQIGRIAVGLVTGLFFNQVYKEAFKSSNIPMKIIGFAGAMGTCLGVGHAIDLWFDKLMPSNDEIMEEVLKDDLEEISKE